MTAFFDLGYRSGFQHEKAKPSHYPDNFAQIWRFTTEIGVFGDQCDGELSHSGATGRTEGRIAAY